MYDTFKFAESSQKFTFTSINDAITKSFDFEITPINYSLRDIEVSDKGKIILNRNEEFSITKEGFESFLSLLGIPTSYSRKVSPDLLLLNISKLISYNEEKIVTFLFRKDNSILSIVSDGYSEASYKDLLLLFESKPIKKIEMSDSYLKITFVFEELFVPTDDSDKIYVGQFLVSSLTGKPKLQINAGLYRIECENSFIMPLLGKVVANYSKPLDLRLKRFFDTFECINNDINSTVFRNFSFRKKGLMNELEVKETWSKISRIFSESDADLMFEFDEHTRKLLFSRVYSYLLHAKKARMLGESIPLPSLTNYSYYSIANKITSHAHLHLYDLKDQINAEYLGGELLRRMIFSNN